MATLDVAVGNDWVDIKSTLSLVAGSKYVMDSIQGGTTYIRESSSTPASLIGHPIDPKESRLVTITSEGLWVRSNSASTKIVLTLEA